MNSRLNFAIAIAAAAALGTPGAMGTYIDAFGDAQDTFGAGPPLLDIDAVHVLYDDTTLFVEMTFHNTISAPSLDRPDSVIGAIDLDTDQNPATGTSPFQNLFSPPFAMLDAGIDFYLELDQEIINPGFIGLFNGKTFELIALLPIMFDTMSFSTEVPLALLNDDDGVLDFTVLIGTLAQPTDATDFVATSSAVPAPGVLSLDIKPGSCPNSFNRNSNGVLPVALVGTDSFDPMDVDLDTVLLSRADGFGGSAAPHEGPPGPHSTFGDVATPFPGEPCDCHGLTGDGTDDLSIKFKSQDVVSALQLDGEPSGALIELRLSGELNDGTAFSSTDCIRLVPPGTPPGVLLVGSNLPNIWVDLYPRDDQLDEGGFTSFNRSFPQSTVVFLSIPLHPTAHPNWRLSSYFIDGVEYPYTGNSQNGQVLIDLEIAGSTNVLALKYKFYGSFQVPGFQGANQD